MRVKRIVWAYPRNAELVNMRHLPSVKTRKTGSEEPPVFP
tara:strand:- start:1011 stop:1130 length:120 start_codon:yes stop_codon:yes gene_type:complete